MIRVLVVDDEPPARAGLCARLAAEPDLAVVGEAEDGHQAVELVRALSPEVLFLDIQMPGRDGFQVLEDLAGTPMPRVVFVTAHDRHALQAFEINALDYLLKPYSDERFLESLRRVRAAIAEGDAGSERERISDLLRQLEEARRGESHPRRFSVRDRDRVVFVRSEEIDAVEAAGNYVTLVTAGRRHLLRLTLSEMESQLDSARFVRIHRSTLVNLDRVKEMRPDPHGDSDVVMHDGSVYRLSRTFRDRVIP